MSQTPFEKTWLSKTLESLENDYWGPPQSDTYLVTTCHQLRKKPLIDFETEDLRIMIGQNIGLRYLIPMALDELTYYILASGHMYEGDLLKVVLTSDKEYWKNNPDQWRKMCALFNNQRPSLITFDTTIEIRQGWFDSFAKFEKID